MPKASLRLLVPFFAVSIMVLGAIAYFRYFATKANQQAKDDTTAQSDSENIEPHPQLPEATYVGTHVCAECHQKEYESYLQTSHSRSLAVVDPSKEPLDATFEHEPSRRSYEVRREDSQMLHIEKKQLADNESSLVTAYPVKFLVGSGNHTRSYLVEDRGFLVESPITWYESKSSWGMSPGYDRPQHRGFEREADTGCLICHVGSIKDINNRHSNLEIPELSISCERCHGPGSAHVAERKQKPELEGDADPTIINPNRLSRSLNESICADCHLRGEATVHVRGHQLGDFRPGLPLNHFRIDYQLRKHDSQMKVVGHVEQMRLSKCYEKSESLTCTTCHNPHRQLDPAEAVSFFRERCLECHSSSCKLPEPERLKVNAEDNCVHCHMPQTDTDIPHIAFTHHRIGLHKEQDQATTTESNSLGQLVAIDDPKTLHELERDRCLGLAYLELSDRSPPKLRATYRTIALDLLERAAVAGLNDGDALAGLARIYFELNSPEATKLAEQALADSNISPRAAVNALVILGQINFRAQKMNGARNALSKLTQLRRNADDWLMLGMAQANSNSLEHGIESLQRAAEISPYREDIRRTLAEAYRVAGDTKRAEEQEAIAKELAASLKQK